MESGRSKALKPSLVLAQTNTSSQLSLATNPDSPKPTSPGWWERSKQLLTVITGPSPTVDGPTVQDEQKESDIHRRLVQLRQQERGKALSETLALEKQELELRLDLLFLVRSSVAADNVEDREIEIDELKLALRRIQLRRKRLHADELNEPNGQTGGSNGVGLITTDDSVSPASDVQQPRTRADTNIDEIGNESGGSYKTTNLKPESNLSKEQVRTKTDVSSPGRAVPGKRLVKVSSNFDARRSYELTVAAGQLFVMEDHYKGRVLLTSSGQKPDMKGWVPESHVTIQPLAGRGNADTNPQGFNDRPKSHIDSSERQASLPITESNADDDEFYECNSDNSEGTETHAAESVLYQPTDTLSSDSENDSDATERSQSAPLNTTILESVSNHALETNDTNSIADHYFPALPVSLGLNVSGQTSKSGGNPYTSAVLKLEMSNLSHTQRQQGDEPLYQHSAPAVLQSNMDADHLEISELGDGSDSGHSLTQNINGYTRKWAVSALDAYEWNTAVKEAAACLEEDTSEDLSSGSQQQSAETVVGQTLRDHTHAADAQGSLGDDLNGNRLSLATSMIDPVSALTNSSHDSKVQTFKWSRFRKGLFGSTNLDNAESAPEVVISVAETGAIEPTTNTGLDSCQCGRKCFPQDECFFCWPCDGRLFCAECWNTWPLHVAPSRFLEGAVGLCHEKCDPAVARTIIGTLHSHGNLEEQELLHLKDTDTTWFGTSLDGHTGDTIFQDFGRYADLMVVNSDVQKRSRYPGLISFVGETGAGKSSLIRLLIELHAPVGADPQVPVVGSNIRVDLPTSGDVHLYPDLRTFETPKPLLFADCEGLDGGEREPMGARSRFSDKGSNANKSRTRSFTKHIRKQYHTTDREILWADSAEKRSREYHVRNLYPRLLFTFSDVIVFVMKNPKVIENTIDQLIKWAAAALETSSNQPVLPHAIIVLNACEDASEPSLWDVTNSTVDLLENVSRAVYKHHSIRKFAEFWRQRGKQIESIEALLLSYYSSIRVVRVPDRSRPKLIEEQMRKLYDEIANASEKSRASKHKVRMLLNSDDLQPYLQYAFDHFCRDLDRPFDFVQASFANNPIPSNFGGNILKLAIDIMDLWKDRLDAASIFKELSFMVASCIMIDSARHRTLGPAEKVFPAYLHHCDSAVQGFCDKHWPCEFVQENPRGIGRCVNVKAGHTKGHQLSSGKVLAVGPYESERSTDELSEFFEVGVLFNLTKLLERLNKRTAGRPHLELEEAAKIHQAEVMNLFYQHLQGPSAFVSHTACYSCLVSPPEHALPCGHVICTPCAQMFGRLRGHCLVEMTECPIHQNDAEGQFSTRWPLSIKPGEAGVRVLSLDGGGVRGMVELMILKQIQHNLGPRLPIQAFLDLILGTSTGGIIALGLGAYGWPINRCIERFENLCVQAFTKRKDYGLPGLGYVLSSWHSSRYETAPIEYALKSAFGSQRHLFAGSRVDVEDSTVKRLTKVGVTTATTAGTAVLLANYNRPDDHEGAPYLLHRAEKAHSEIKAWEAARATSAVPTYFKPFAHEPSGQVYVDGALRFNCPVEVANREQRLIWPDRPESHPDILLSIGTGYNCVARKPYRPILRRRPGKGFVAHAKFLKYTIVNNMMTSLDSEQTWRNFEERSNLPDHLKGRYVRLNLVLDVHPPELDMVEALPTLKLKTEQQFGAEDFRIVDVTNRLLATAFYFRLDQDQAVPMQSGVQKLTVKGTIECRFTPGSSEIRALGDLLRVRQKYAYNQMYKQHNPYFVIQERRDEDKSQQVILTAERVDHMRNTGNFSIDQVSIELNNSRAEHEMFFCFADQPSEVTLYPISGFPRCFMDEVVKVHHVHTVDDVRQPDTSRFETIWASLKQRKQQFNFAAADFLKIKDPLKLFSDAKYTNPGGTDRSALHALSMRFKPSGSISSSDATYSTSSAHTDAYTSSPARPGSPTDQDTLVSELDTTSPVSAEENQRRHFLQLLMSSGQRNTKSVDDSPGRVEENASSLNAHVDNEESRNDSVDATIEVSPEAESAYPYIQFTPTLATLSELPEPSFRTNFDTSTVEESGSPNPPKPPSPSSSPYSFI